MSIWHDVAYDVTSARQAMDELEYAARRLDELTRARERLAEDARRDWHGGGRDDFDDRLGRLVSSSDELVHDLRSAAARIEADLDAAAGEQRRRLERRAEVERPVAGTLR